MRWMITSPGFDAEIEQRLGAIVIADEYRRLFGTLAEQQVGLHPVIPCCRRTQQVRAAEPVVGIVQAIPRRLLQVLLEIPGRGAGSGCGGNAVRIPKVHHIYRRRSCR